MPDDLVAYKRCERLRGGVATWLKRHGLVNQIIRKYNYNPLVESPAHIQHSLTHSSFDGSFPTL